MKGAAIKKTEAQFSFSSWPNFDPHALLYNLQIAFDARICCTRQEPVSHDLKGCKIKFSVLKIALFYHPNRKLKKKKKAEKISYDVRCHISVLGRSSRPSSSSIYNTKR